MIPARALQDAKRTGIHMTEEIHQFPKPYTRIDAATKSSGFTMASDALTGSMLRTLACSKPAGKFLELGTGTGLSTAWILDGMDANATLTSVDNDPRFLEIAESYLGGDKRLRLICADGHEWVEANEGQKYDFIFADTWHGKFLLLDEVLAMLNQGGLYIIDDMQSQPSWPDGHADKVLNLIRVLESREDITLTKDRKSVV